MFGCAQFSYRKMKQALKSVFGKGVRMKESMEVILSHSSWGLDGFLSRSKQFKGRLGQKTTDYPKNAVSFGAQLWFGVPAAAKLVDFDVGSN